MELLIKLVIFLIMVAVGYWRGRRNEREHLRSLDREEDEVADVMVFATRYPPTGAGTLDPLLVTGSAVVASDHFRMFLASLRKVVGGNYLSYEQLMERGRRQAIVRMKQAAKARGAKMIFNMRITTSRISDKRRHEAPQVEVLVYGTAFVHAVGSVAQSRAHYRPGPELPTTDSGAFALHKHRFSRNWLGVFVLLMLYVFFEAVTHQAHAHEWQYVSGAPWSVFAAIAVGVSGLTIWRSRRTKTPLSTQIVLGLLTAAVLPLALFFSVSRINVLGLDDVAPTRYRLQEDRTLVAVDGRMPGLDVGIWPAYWQSQKPGTIYEVPVVRGWLGIYQMDVTALTHNIKVYRQQNDRADRPARTQ